MRPATAQALSPLVPHVAVALCCSSTAGPAGAVSTYVCIATAVDHAATAAVAVAVGATAALPADAAPTADNASPPTVLSPSAGS